MEDATSALKRNGSKKKKISPKNSLANNISYYTVPRLDVECESEKDDIIHVIKNKNRGAASNFTTKSNLMDSFFILEEHTINNDNLHLHEKDDCPVAQDQDDEFKVKEEIAYSLMYTAGRKKCVSKSSSRRKYIKALKNKNSDQHHQNEYIQKEEKKSVVTYNEDNLNQNDNSYVINNRKGGNVPISTVTTDISTSNLNYEKTINEESTIPPRRTSCSSPRPRNPISSTTTNTKNIIIENQNIDVNSNENAKAITNMNIVKEIKDISIMNPSNANIVAINDNDKNKTNIKHQNIVSNDKEENLITDDSNETLPIKTSVLRKDFSNVQIIESYFLLGSFQLQGRNSNSCIAPKLRFKSFAEFSNTNMMTNPNIILNSSSSSNNNNLNQNTNKSGKTRSKSNVDMLLTSLNDVNSGKLSDGDDDNQKEKKREEGELHQEFVGKTEIESDFKVEFKNEIQFPNEYKNENERLEQDLEWDEEVTIEDRKYYSQENFRYSDKFLRNPTFWKHLLKSMRRKTSKKI